MPGGRSRRWSTRVIVFALTPEDLGLRTTYLATGPVTNPVSDIDLAIPFAVEP